MGNESVLAPSSERNQKTEAELVSAAYSSGLIEFVRDIGHKLVEDPNYIPSLDLISLVICRQAYETPMQFGGEAIDFSDIPWPINESEIVDRVGDPQPDRDWDSYSEVLLEPSSIFPSGIRYGFSSEIYKLHTGLSKIIQEMSRRLSYEDFVDMNTWLFDNAGPLMKCVYYDDPMSPALSFALLFDYSDIRETEYKSFRQYLIDNIARLLPYLREPAVRSYIRSLCSNEMFDIPLESQIQILSASDLELEQRESLILVSDLLQISVDLEDIEEGMNYLLWDGRYDERTQEIRFSRETESNEPYLVDELTSEETGANEVVQMCARVVTELLNYHNTPEGFVHLLNLVRKALNSEVYSPRELMALELIGKFMLFGDPFDSRIFHTELMSIYQISKFELYPPSIEAAKFRGQMLKRLINLLIGEDESVDIMSLGSGSFWTELDLLMLGMNVYGLELSETNIEVARETISARLKSEGQEDDEIHKVVGEMVQKGNWDDLANWFQLQKSKQQSGRVRVFTITGRSLSHEEEEEIFFSTLVNIYNNMEPGDYLIFDMPDPDTGSYKRDRDVFRQRLKAVEVPIGEAENAHYLVDGPDMENLYNRYVPDEAEILRLIQKAGLQVVNPSEQLSDLQQQFGDYVTDTTDTSLKERIGGHLVEENRNMLFVCRKPLDAPKSQTANFAYVRNLMNRAV